MFFMAKTIEEIIEVNSHFEKIGKVEIVEIFCGFNDAEEKTVYSGHVENLPDSLKKLKYSMAGWDGDKMIVKYTDQKSFEGRQIQRPLQIQKKK